jgi:DNA-binding transcriptional LysR family regulator
VIAGMGVSFLSAHTISLELQAGSLAVLDVEGFPVMLNWYIVHRKNKRLPPVAQAFKNFLLTEGPELIERLIRYNPKPGKQLSNPPAKSLAKSKK